MNKSKDLMILIFAVIVAGGMGMVSSNLIFKKGTSTKVEVVTPIVADFDFVDKPYFKEDSINPTRDITIKPNDNENLLGE